MEINLWAQPEGVRDVAGEIVESVSCDALLGNPQCGEVINLKTAVGSFFREKRIVGG